MATRRESPHKVYVKVRADFDFDGKLIPLLFRTEDGAPQRIDRVLDVRQAASLKAGGQGDRYTVLINGRETYLFFEHSTCMSADTGRWFVEKKITYR